MAAVLARRAARFHCLLSTIQLNVAIASHHTHRSAILGERLITANGVNHSTPVRPASDGWEHR